jgi:acyl-CoA synthetase (AMP-forming)/AMP-acid ligase II
MSFLGELEAAVVKGAGVESTRGALRGDELWRAVHKLMDALEAAGVRAGDRIVLLTGDTVAHAVALLAVLSHGCVAVPMDPTSPQARLVRLAEHAQARAVISLEGGALPGVEARTQITLDAMGAPVHFGEPARGPGPPPAPAGLMIYTSGSTGNPKGVLLPLSAIQASLAHTRAALGWGPHMRMYGVLPLCHGHGLFQTLLGPILSGGTAVIERLDLWAVANFWRRAAETSVTHLSLVPALVELLHRVGPDRVDDVLVLATCASSRLPVGLREDFEARFGLPLRECYGLTEAASWCAWPDTAAPASGVGVPRPGTLRISQGGLVELRGDQLFSAYWRNPEATEGAWTSDGWFRTGDVGEVDGSGALHLRGRQSDVIDRAGAKIHPEEVDEVLMAHPNILDVATVGVPSGLSEVPVAVVVVEAGTELEELHEWCTDRLAKWMCPTRFLRRSALPKTSTGKICRADLRAEVASLLGEEA